MRNDHTPAEKARITLGAGFSAAIAARLLFRFTEDLLLLMLALGALLFATVCICYGVGQLAVSKGRSAAWGFAGFVGYLIVNFMLKPKTQAPPPRSGLRVPPPPPPPGYVPTR